MAEKRYVTVDNIRSALVLPREEVEVTAWEGYVVLQGLSGRERDDFEASTIEYVKKKRGRQEPVPKVENVRARLVVRCVIDKDTGRRLLSDTDAEWLGDGPASVLQQLFEVASRLSGMSDDDLEDLTQGLGTAPNGASGSDSPTP